MCPCEALKNKKFLINDISFKLLRPFYLKHIHILFSFRFHFVFNKICPSYLNKSDKIFKLYSFPRWRTGKTNDLLSKILFILKIAKIAGSFLTSRAADHWHTRENIAKLIRDLNCWSRVPFGVFSYWINDLPLLVRQTNISRLTIFIKKLQRRWWHWYKEWRWWNVNLRTNVVVIHEVMWAAACRYAECQVNARWKTNLKLKHFIPKNWNILISDSIRVITS